MDCRIKSGNDDLTIRSDLFDFELPAGSIALRPANPRDGARPRHAQEPLRFQKRVEAHFAES
jgi:S-adenosylmethionine:tRNA ribosyltransferase-isomerase